MWRMVPNTQGELLEGKNSGLVMVDIKLKHDSIIINESSSGTALMGLCGFFLSVKFAHRGINQKTKKNFNESGRVLKTEKK